MNGNGTTFAITSPTVAVGRVVSIQQGEATIPVIDDDALDTEDNHEKVFGELVENGPETLTCVFNPNDVPVLSSTPSTGTLTYPNGATKAGTGAITAVRPSSIENDVRMLVDFEFTWDGKTGPARTDGS